MSNNELPANVGTIGHTHTPSPEILDTCAGTEAAFHIATQQPTEDLPVIPDAWYHGITEKHFERAMYAYGRLCRASGFEDGKRLEHEQSIAVTHRLIAERDAALAKQADALPVPEDWKQLFAFYAVTNAEDLIKAQEDHIVRLQEKLSKLTPNTSVFTKVREG